MKLFRDIRQSLIKKGNLKKYLFYAVGEILLVMIGISLAFQLSNWDDNRIKKNAEISSGYWVFSILLYFNVSVIFPAF